MTLPFTRWLLLASLLCVSLPGRTADITVIHNQAEPKYFVGLLEAALEATRDMGGFELKPSETRLSTARLIDAIADDTGAANIMTRGSNLEEEERLMPVRIPLDRGLLGYRIMLVRKADVTRFANVNSVEELRRIPIGQGSRWPDANILRASGMKVVGGYYSPGLLRMLDEGRFDMFARAPWEAPASLAEAEKQGLTDIVIEPSLVLVYPYPRIFMVSRKGSGPELAKRLDTGLRRMIANGQFEAMFNDFFGPAIENTRLRERRVLRIDNKLISPETPFDDPTLWFASQTASQQP